MTAPSIFTVSPSEVSTSGGYLVTVYGDGFRVRETPDVISGPVPTPGPTVRVTVGDAVSEHVLVPRSNRLLFRLPPSPVPPVLVRSSAAQHSFTAATRTIGRASGSFVTDGFVAGSRVTVAGSASNDSDRANRSYSVGSVSALSLVLDAHEALTDEAAVACTVTCRTYGEGKADLTVENLDDNGVPIPGEAVTAPLALRYRRVQLAEQDDLQRLVRELVRQMRLGIIANVSTSTHTDFDAEPLNLQAVELAELPGIAVVGPELDENRVYATCEQMTEPSMDGEALEHLAHRAPFTVDLTFSLVGMSERKAELLTLLALVVKFFHRNKYLRMAADPADPGGRQVAYEMDWASGGVPKVAGGASDSNLRSFSGTFVIRGFDVEDLPGIVGEGVIDRSAEVEEIMLTPLGID
jgi:hypothetical protein